MLTQETATAHLLIEEDEEEEVDDLDQTQETSVALAPPVFEAEAEKEHFAEGEADAYLLKSIDIQRANCRR
jgi:hypothetical protein